VVGIGIPNDGDPYPEELGRIVARKDAMQAVLKNEGYALRSWEAFQENAAPWKYRAEFERDDEATETICSLVEETEHITRADIAAWTDAECEAVEAYCGAIHFHASDNDDVVIPPRPDVLDRYPSLDPALTPGCLTQLEIRN